MAIGTGTAIALGLSTAASTASAIAGNAAQMSAQDRAKLLQDQSVQEWLKVNIPDPAQQRLALDNFVQVGKLTPELESAVKAQDSEMGRITSDPNLKAARLRALSALEEQGLGGEQVQDTAARQQAMIESGARSRGANEALINSFAQRGQLGSGLELSGRMEAQQAENDRLAKSALDIEAQRRQRALQSLEGAGNLAGDIQNQEFDQKAQIAQARDAINLFNTKNLQDVNNSNVGIKNAAQAANLGQAQRTADQNVGVNNFQQQYNKELLQQKFDNQIKKTAGLTGQYGQQAATDLAAGKSAADMWAGISGGVGTTATGIASAAAKYDKDKEKEDLLG
jgi:hypothetical protein